MGWLAVPLRLMVSPDVRVYVPRGQKNGVAREDAVESRTKASDCSHVDGPRRCGRYGDSKTPRHSSGGRPDLHLTRRAACYQASRRYRGDRYIPGGPPEGRPSSTFPSASRAVAFNCILFPAWTVVAGDSQLPLRQRGRALECPLRTPAAELPTTDFGRSSNQWLAWSVPARAGPPGLTAVLEGTGPSPTYENVAGSYVGVVDATSQGVRLQGDFSVTITQSQETLGGSYRQNSILADGVNTVAVAGTGSLSGGIASGSNPSVGITAESKGCPNIQDNFGRNLR